MLRVKKISITFALGSSLREALGYGKSPFPILQGTHAITTPKVWKRSHISKCLLIKISVSVIRHQRWHSEGTREEKTSYEQW